jgi:DNA-binding MarR family transcriptional regulator
MSTEIPASPDTRTDTDVAAEVQRQLTVFARRIRTQSAQLHPQLPFVAYSMLSEIDAVGGCRAVDLAHLYRLDKSTVSRQVGDLEKRGLVSRSPDPAGGRGQVLQVTGAGAELLDDAGRRQRAELELRLAHWTDDDRQQFARLLRRYNGD